MGQERHDWDQRQRRMEGTPVERQPRHRAADDEVRPEGADLQAAERIRERQRRDQQRARQGLIRPIAAKRDHHERDRVGDDGQNQQERNGAAAPKIALSR